MELYGKTPEIKTPCGTMKLTINRDEGGAIRETFIRFGRNGSCHHLYSEAVSRLIGLCLRYDIPIEEVAEELIGHVCTRAKIQGYEYGSCVDRIGHALLGDIPGEDVITQNNKPKCPECGMPLFFEEGCAHCRGCGYSLCSL